MEEDGGWVMVGKPTDRDVWSPSRMVGVEAEEAAKPLKITSFEPAKHWTDALPIGNGRLGGMIWGGVASDTINLNGTTLHTCVVYLFIWTLFFFSFFLYLWYIYLI